jgi:hypothetical protein
VTTPLHRRDFVPLQRAADFSAVREAIEARDWTRIRALVTHADTVRRAAEPRQPNNLQAPAPVAESATSMD